MKIDFSEVPNIVQLLNTLHADMQRLEHAKSVEVERLVIAKEDGGRMCRMTKDELLTVLQSRVDANTALLAQRYQLDFRKANVSVAAPRIDVSGIDGPATAEVPA